MNTPLIAYYHALYKSALAFNIVAGIGIIFGLESFHVNVSGSELPQHPLVLMLIALVGFAIVMFGFVYSRAGQRFEYSDGNYLIILCGSAKIAFTLIMVGFVLKGGITAEVLGVIAIDFIFGLLFFESLAYKNKNAAQFSTPDQ